MVWQIGGIRRECREHKPAREQQAAAKHAHSEPGQQKKAGHGEILSRMTLGIKPTSPIWAVVPFNDMLFYFGSYTHSDFLNPIYGHDPFAAPAVAMLDSLSSKLW